MSSPPIDVILKRFESPDETREMIKGRFEIIRIGGVTIGRARYEPGWKWSEHVGPTVGATRCGVEHVGLVLSGTATAAFDNGQVVELRAGQLFYIPPIPHDSWVVGDEPYVSLHFLGAEKYRHIMMVIVFRSKLTPGVADAAGDDYARMAEEMDAHARTFPGFVDVKAFKAEDGERLTLVWWQDEATLEAWATDVRHRAAQRMGRERWYQYYKIEVAQIVRTNNFMRG